MFIMLLTRIVQLRYYRRLIWMLFVPFVINSFTILSQAQIIITSKDMFSDEGHYYKMYSNFVQQHSSDDTFEEVDASEYIGSE